METISNAANSLSSSFWGKNSVSKEEPQSGVQGDTAKGEPYDGGNMGAGPERKPQEFQLDSSAEPKQDALKQDAPEQDAPEQDVQEQDVQEQDAPKQDALKQDALKQDAPQEEPIDSPATAQDSPVTTKDSSKDKGDSTKAQNDTVHPSETRAEPDHAEAANNVDDSGEGPNEVNLDGPGPKPLAEVAKERGGDAGNKEKSEPASGSNRDSAVELDGDEDTKDGDKQEVAGTQYVKSTGLKADGGDFDASRPGAGHEADRLLEQKGFHREEKGIVLGSDKPGSENSNGSPSSSPEHKEKKGFGSKLKAKLHVSRS